MTSISIVITNFNYLRYLPRAIESALSQNTDAVVEVIVVDDGSSDGSVEYLRGVEGILLIEKPNGGQASAYNSGFSISTGAVVLFLDADDLLHPHACEAITRAWQYDWTKCHFFLELIDAEGSQMRGKIPRGLDSGDLSKTISKYGSYRSAPGSGNAYSSATLRQVFPIDEKEWVIGADSVPILQTALLGKVGCIPSVMGAYRVHRTAGHETNGLNSATLLGRWSWAADVDRRSLEAARNFVLKTERDIKLPTNARTPNALTNRLSARGAISADTTVIFAELCRVSLTYPGYRLYERPLLVLRALGRMFRSQLAQWVLRRSVT
jgi:glycosyltransferase involved in cell wall biosynthesis